MAADLQKERDKELEKSRKGKEYSEELKKQIRANEAKAKQEKEMEDSRARHVFECDNNW